MAVPTHGPGCQTLVYPTDCWSCRAPIHVLQCSCGSAILLDTVGPPWDKHECGHGGGIGGSGLSGWAAVDALRSAGAPISPSVMGKIFPAGARPSRQSEAPPIRRVDPARDGGGPLLAVVREESSKTRRTERLDELSDLGRQMLGLDRRAGYRQITLVVNSERPNLSYTCLVPDRLGRTRWAKDQMVFAQIEPRIAGAYAIWLITAIEPI